MNGRSAEAIIENLYPELERRLAKVKPDLLIARQALNGNSTISQLTTQEHVWPAAEQRGSDRHRAQSLG
ncbi:hypothetical protein LN650_26320 [Klebsiella pneumoniae subsp. pneumoniae]|nr:hypothetical protein [Klebsiella pneumoniae subsp. pneumoniae]